MSTSITSTTATQAIPAIVSKDVIMFRKANLGMSGAVSQRYTDAGVGVTQRWTEISAPNSGAARAKSEGNSGNDIVFDATTENAKTVTINQHYYSAFEYEDFASQLSTVELKDKYAEGAAYVVNLAIDDTLAALIDDFSNPVGTLAVDNTDDDVRRADQYLNDANAPQDGRFFGMSPAAKNSMLSIDRYASSDFNRGGGANIIKGSFGEIYGMSTFVSTNIEGTNAAGHDNGVWQRDAIALMLRMKPKVRNFDDILNQSSQFSIAAIWGVVELRDDHGVWLKGA